MSGLHVLLGEEFGSEAVERTVERTAGSRPRAATHKPCGNPLHRSFQRKEEEAARQAELYAARQAELYSLLYPVGEAVEEEEEEEEPVPFEVEAVMDMKRSAQNGQLLFLVKWHGYPVSENSWEPTSCFDTQTMWKPFAQKLSTVMERLVALGASRKQADQLALEALRGPAKWSVEAAATEATATLSTEAAATEAAEEEESQSEERTNILEPFWRGSTRAEAASAKRQVRSGKREAASAKRRRWIDKEQKKDVARGQYHVAPTPPPSQLAVLARVSRPLA